MDRVEKSKEKYKQLFGGGVPAAYAADPDFQDILSRFIFGVVFYKCQRIVEKTHYARG